jgi:hypothetical protein
MNASQLLWKSMAPAIGMILAAGLFRSEVKAEEPENLYVAIADIPTCDIYGISVQLAEYSLAGNEAAYIRMFEQQAESGKCRMMPQGTAVLVNRAMPNYNLVEMMAYSPEGDLVTIYGPGMMLDPAN